VATKKPLPDMTGLRMNRRGDPVCVKCRAESGDSWAQCNRDCPIPMSPHYKPKEDKKL